MSFERIVQFQPAYDKRDPDPSKNCGIHGVTLRMVLKGELGATQFVLYTNWQLPNVVDEWKAQLPSAIHSLMQPCPADFGYHWLTPTWDDHDSMECDILEGGKCYYDGSGLNAHRIYERLITEGDEAVWGELEAYYAELAAPR